MGRLCEQAESAGPCNGLRATVRAQLAAHVTDVRPDRVHRHRQLAGDLRSRQVGRQIAQHPGLTLAQRLSQPGRRLLRHPSAPDDDTPRPLMPCWKQAENLSDQRRMLGAVPGMALEQRRDRVGEEREEPSRSNNARRDTVPPLIAGTGAPTPAGGRFGSTAAGSAAADLIVSVSGSMSIPFRRA
jgi:hypothetical protein